MYLPLRYRRYVTRIFFDSLQIMRRRTEHDVWEGKIELTHKVKSLLIETAKESAQ